MTRFEFINTLRTAMHGLPADKVERIVAEHEQRFEQGMAAGKSEEQIAHELGDPWDIAAQARIPVRERAANGAAKAGRVFISGLGLAIFNLFMVIPGAIYGVILMALYVAGLAVYFAGILMTASSLAGVDDIAFRVPFESMTSQHPVARIVDHLDHGGRVRLTIDDNGILIRPADDDSAYVNDQPAASASAQTGTSAAATASASASKIVVEEQDEDRTLRVVRSIGIILGGIVLLLLCGIATRYTWIGLKRYVQMNIATLRNA